MAGVSSERRSTLDHKEPLAPTHETASAALVAVLPRELALPMPEVFAPVGRRWFSAHGIEDREVSSRHVQLSIREGQPHVCDVGSRNGTWLNGRRLSADEVSPLEDGAVLRLGDTLLVYRERFVGERQPSAPLGELVGPFGLRSLSLELSSLARLAPGNVLIEGETGSGKELLAREVARALGRARPFVAVNVAAVPAGLFESQLFGHVAGAFSEARHASKGLVAAHEGGAVFLDELGELSGELQPKLLRLLENREVLPVGSERPVRVDVLFIAATNRDLAEHVVRGSFRRDLLARFASAHLRIPALRARREDVLAIARELAPRCGLVLDSTSTEVEAVERLLLEPWPDNVRGLHAALVGVAKVDRDPGLRLWAVAQALGKPVAPGSPAATELGWRAALEAANGNVSEAARKLGISRGKLLRLLEKADR